MVQERDLLQQTLGALLTSLRTTLHSSLVERMYRSIGVQLGRQVCERYRLVHGLSRPLSSKREYGRCLQSLEESLGWPCRATEEAADWVRFEIAQCPFGSGASSATDFCRLTSGLFGGVAADQFGYAKVCLQRGQGIPPRNCCITVYIRHTDESAAVEGDVYQQDREGKTEPIGKPVGEEPRQRLSPRECEMLKLIGEGMTDKEIAEALHLSVRTVENHGARLRDKLGVSGRTGLVRFALRHRLAEL